MLTITTNPSSVHPKECKVICHCGFDLYFSEERKFYLFLSDFDGLQVFCCFLFSEFLCWEHWVRCRAEAVRERDPSLVPDCNSKVFSLVLSSVVLDVGFSEMTFIITVRHFLLFLIWWLIIVMSNYPTIEIVIHFVLHSVNPYEHYWFLKINLKLHDFTKCFYDSYCISTSSHEFSVCGVISFHLQVEDSNSSFLVF